MRFGIFYEHQLPRPWAEDSEYELFQQSLDQIELADRLGYDYAWEVEHHFLEEYSHSSAPEVFLAAASQRTKRIRLGHGIVQLPPGFNHPARIAERIATLDLVSGGRVEFGTGEASSQMELGGFGVERDQKRAQWDEALDAITRMFVEDPFAGYEGRFISMPPRNVVPKPKQRPHPPLWVACSRRETILLAARKGIGALSFSFVEPEEAAQWVDDYRRILASEECVPGGFAVNPQIAVVLPMMCHRDEQTAIERGIDGGHFFGYSLAHYYVFGEHEPGHTDVWRRFQEERDQRGFARSIVTPDDAPLGVKLLQQGLGSLRGAIGTPEQITDLVRRYEAAGVDQVIFVSQAGRNRHEHICESIELFGQEVLPRFEEQRERREGERDERLRPAVEAALARREAARPAPADYVVTPQGEPKAARRAELIATGNGAGPAESLLAPVVSGRSDSEVERWAIREEGLAAIFKAMTGLYNPSSAGGFQGEIQYRLGLGDGGIEEWVIVVAGEAAEARPGRASQPAVELRIPLATFVRIAAGEIPAGRAFLDGHVEVDGDIRVAGRIGEMFGGRTAF